MPNLKDDIEFSRERIAGDVARRIVTIDEVQFFIFLSQLACHDEHAQIGVPTGVWVGSPSRLVKALPNCGNRSKMMKRIAKLVRVGWIAAIPIREDYPSQTAYITTCTMRRGREMTRHQIDLVATTDWHSPVWVRQPEEVQDAAA